MGFRSFSIGALCLASSAFARTDLQGCTSYDSVVHPSGMAPYATRIWYVPDSGEVCAALDCGGGRAPPKTTVPGCPLYRGTETYSPSFIDPKTLGGGAAAGSSSTSSSSGTETTPTSAPSSTPSSAPASSTTSTSASTSASGPITTTTPSTTASQSLSSSLSEGTNVTSTVTAGNSTSSSSTPSSTRPASSSIGAAASFPTAGAMLAPCVLVGVAAGFGFF